MRKNEVEIDIHKVMAIAIGRYLSLNYNLN